MTDQLFTSTDVDYEVAIEMLGSIIAHHYEAIAAERSKPIPDQAAIESAQKEQDALYALRDDLRPADDDAIQRVLEQYSPLARKLYAR